MAKGYWIAHIDISDPLKHALFVEHCTEAIERLGGRILVRTDDGVRASGKLRQRSIVIEFDSYNDAVSLLDDPQHTEARRLIADHCEIDMVVVPGTEDPLLLTSPANVRSQRAPYVRQRDLAEQTS